MAKQRNNKKRVQKSAKTHALVCKGVPKVIAAMNLIHQSCVSSIFESQTSAHIDGEVKQSNTEDNIVMDDDTLHELIHEHKQYCLFFSLENSLVGKAEHQRALCAGREHTDIEEAVVVWEKKAQMYVKKLTAKREQQKKPFEHVERESIGYRASDAYEYLQGLKRGGFIRGFLYKKVLTDDPRGIDFAILARHERREFRNKRIILHGITANKDFVKKIAGGLFRNPKPKKTKNKGKGKGKGRSKIIKKTQAEIEAGYIEKMKRFHPRILKNRKVKAWEKKLNEGKYKESENYPFSAHAICIVFDANGYGWIGNPANYVWKPLNFRNFVENMIWTYSAYEFNIVL